MKNIEYPTYFDENYLYSEEVYYSKFDRQLSLVLEHAKALYTPEKLLRDILNRLKTENQFLCYNIEDIRKYSNEKTNKDFTRAINSNLISANYKIYVLYFDPINDIDKLNWTPKYQIHDKFIETPLCPVYRFYNKKVSIIVLNNKIIKLSDWINAEVQLDHELNHLFSILSEEEIPNDINEELQEECKLWFLKNNICIPEEINSNDFSLHMFNKSEFYSMTANVCNILSLYFKDKTNIELFNYFNNVILTDKFLLSEEFSKFEEPIRGAIIFAFICKKYSPERWFIVLSSIKKQLDIDKLNSIKYYIKIGMIKLKEFFNIFKK